MVLAAFVVQISGKWGQTPQNMECDVTRSDDLVIKFEDIQKFKLAIHARVNVIEIMIYLPRPKNIV